MIYKMKGLLSFELGRLTAHIATDGNPYKLTPFECTYRDLNNGHVRLTRGESHWTLSFKTRCPYLDQQTSRGKKIKGYTRHEWNFGLRLVKAFCSEWAHRLDPRPQYFWYSSTDCDHVHIEHTVSYKNGWAAHKAITAEYEQAEGPTSFSPLTKKEWREAAGIQVHRDYVLEAHEDGHPYSVRG